MKIDISKLDKVLESYSSQKGALIPVLQGTQELYGYIPKEAITKIADALSITEAEIYGVATFYSQFRMTPVGKNIIRVCHGTACHVGGSNVLDEMLKSTLGVTFGETTKDGLFTVLSVACLGCCSLAPVVMINDKTYGKLTNDKLSKIIEQYTKES